jgi:flavorubredoxin
MQTRIDEIDDGVYRLSTYVKEVAAPAGFTFNQFLIVDDEPLLFHCGYRGMFESISAAIAKIIPPETLRWISFSHLEGDEAGAMNMWLARAPHAEVAHGALGCDISLNDLADRRPRALADGETFSIGKKRIRYFATPHVPHGWDSGLMYEETAGILLCSDLLTHLGDAPALGGLEIVEEALAAEEMFQTMSVTPATIETIRRLAQLRPKTLAVMHGAALKGDGAAALQGLADGLEKRMRAAA